MFAPIRVLCVPGVISTSRLGGGGSVWVCGKVLTEWQLRFTIAQAECAAAVNYAELRRSAGASSEEKSIEFASTLSTLSALDQEVRDLLEQVQRACV